uniref:Bladder cancer-associated protein n=1 Tax=Glossina pallidipes TaxID=7398 RepID=A0A1A9ZSC4_GLOPL
MYCLQCLLPVLLLPKPTNPALMETHVMFIVLYLIGFFLERKPCTICSLVFLTAVFLICYSGVGNCIFWETYQRINILYLSKKLTFLIPHIASPYILKLKIQQVKRQEIEKLELTSGHKIIYNN